mmetsp:Transcript_13103/g.31058  ORF Transcript_13103/g.31058 Transcript_13103/m.31058 type:complete len:142 (+) Transcript_13103:103-528(+)
MLERALLLLATLLNICFNTATATLVRCGSTEGNILIKVHSEWAPNGAERFLALVEDGFFSDSPLFRVVPGFLVQFGIGSTPEETSKWQVAGTIPDDPNIGQNSEIRLLLSPRLLFTRYTIHTRHTCLFSSRSEEHLISSNR